MKPISRREFTALVAAGAVSGGFATPLEGVRARSGSHPRAVTAGEVLERIRSGVGVAWRPDTLDTIRAGNPDTVVTGIVTTAMATLGVLREAAGAGANLVISAEPTFYGRADARTPPAPRVALPAAPTPPPAAAPDPVYAAKNGLVDERGMVIVRFVEHWRARRPDPFVQGLADALGWRPAAPPDATPPFTFTETTLAALAADVKRRLGSRGGIRVIGDPETRVGTGALLPGSSPIAAALAAVPGADVVVAGEVREWETVEYLRDVVHAGQQKGLILVGRVVSEEPGMALCARWLETVVPEVPVRHIAAGDPYWRPGA
jgi:putative NIF3 family GTP cyclohydrolase 1 type 2